MSVFSTLIISISRQLYRILKKILKTTFIFLFVLTVY